MAEAIILGNIKEGVQGHMAQVQSARYNAMQMKFAAHQSNTAYQRTMADMSLAGLNPILAAGNGPSQAMSPNSAMQVSQANTGGGEKLGAQLAEQQIDRARARADIGLTQQQESNARSQQSNIHKENQVLEETRLNKVQERANIDSGTARNVAETTAAASLAAKNMADSERILAERDAITTGNKLRQYDLEGARNAYEIERAAGPWLQGAERILPLLPGGPSIHHNYQYRGN